MDKDVYIYIAAMPDTITQALYSMKEGTREKAMVGGSALWRPIAGCFMILEVDSGCFLSGISVGFYASLAARWHMTSLWPFGGRSRVRPVASRCTGGMLN